MLERVGCIVISVRDTVMFFIYGEALSTVAWLETAERASYVLGRFVEVANAVSCYLRSRCQA